MSAQCAHDHESVMTDEVIGLETTGDDAARLMLTFIRSDWIDVEPALFRGKWFDYRFLNPVQATYLYAHYFEKFYRLAFSANIDSATAVFISPLPKGDWFSLPVQADAESDKHFAAKIKRRKTLISGLWRGRQVADAMGVPYDLYLERAFHWTLRYWQQSHLPRPQHLYSDLVTDRTAIDWEERQGSKLYFSEKAPYKNRAYQCLHSQDAHHEWLFEQAARRGNDPAVLARLIFQEELMPAEKARARIGEEAFDRVLASADHFPMQ
jgi:hypothetical protein